MFDDTTLSGIEELDVASHGDPYGTVGRLTIFARERVAVVGPCLDTFKEASLTLEKVFNMSTLRKAQNIVLTYESKDLKVETLYTEIEKVLTGIEHKLCVGKVLDGTVMVYIRKQDYKYLPDLSMLSDAGELVAPVLYRFLSIGKSSSQWDSTLISLSQAVGESETNITLIAPRVGTYSFDQLEFAFKQLSPTQKLRVKGAAEAVPVKKRTEFEQTLLRCFTSLSKCHDLSAKAISFVFEASKPPWAVCPLEFIINSEQCGTRLREQTSGAAMERHSIHSLVSDPSLMARYGIILASPKSGIGKTQFACRLAMEWSLQAVRAAGLSDSRARVCFTNSFDAAKVVKFEQYMVWVIDEVSPGDVNQLAFSSDNILKVLLDPGVGCTVNAKHGSIDIPACVPRIFTCNNRSPEDWVSNGGKNRTISWQPPHARKSIYFQLSLPLCKPSWKSDAVAAGVAERCNTDLVIENSRLALQARAALIPATVVDATPASNGFISLLCPVRR